MSIDFEKYAIKGNEFVQLVTDELAVPTDKAGRIIRAVFHSLRNRLTHEESFQLLAQLPMSLKGVYVDGWRFSKDFNRITHIADFLEEVRKEDGRLAEFDFGDLSNTKTAVAAVFKALKYFVSDGEIQDIMDVLPAALKKFVKQSLVGTETIL